MINSIKKFVSSVMRIRRELNAFEAVIDSCDLPLPREESIRYRVGCKLLGLASSLEDRLNESRLDRLRIERDIHNVRYLRVVADGEQIPVDKDVN